MSLLPRADPAGNVASGFGMRLASAFDIPLIAVLHADSFTGVLAGQVWDETAVAEVLSMPGAYGLIAVTKNTEPAGFLLGCIVADSGEILSLGTARAYRRRGVARALLRAAMTHAEAAGVARLYLEVAEDNIAARDLYDGAGFARIARRPAYYRRAHGPAVSAMVLAYDFG